MTMTQIRYFLAMGKYLNFTKAADEMFITQQVMSKQIKHLEDEIGIALFKRDKRNVELTEGGKMLYAFWSDYFQGYEKVLNKAQRVMQQNEQIVRIGTIDVSKIYDWVAYAVSEFSLEKPKWQFRVNSGSYLHLLQGLLDERFDCIISLEDENRALPDGFEEVVFYRSAPKLILSEDHPAYHENVRLSELRDYPLFTFSSAFSKNAMNNVLNYCTIVGIQPQQISEFNEISSLEMALHASQGYTLTYDLFFRNPIGKLKAVEIDDEVENSVCNFSISYDKKKEKIISPFVDAFKKILEDENNQFWK